MIRKKLIFMDSVLVGIIFIMILLMFILSSCKHEPPVLPLLVDTTGTGGNGNGGGNGGGGQSTCDPDTAYFQSQVLPLLISNCTRSTCHNSTDQADGVILDSYANVMSTADVDPGRPGNSDLYEVLIETDPDKRMPLDAQPLSVDQRNIIYNWINQGALNNNCTNNCDTNNVTFSGSIVPLINASCLGCHNGPLGGGGVDLSNYQGVSTVALNGRLLGAVRWDNGFFKMPKGGAKLSDCKIDQIRIWIENGAPNN